MIKVRFAELHAPLFHGGKNHGLKLTSKDGLSLEYDKKEKELLVTYKNVVAHIPSTSVHSYEKASAKEEELVFVPPKPVIQGKVKAQVSGPHDHVFQGEGKGIVRNK